MAELREYQLRRTGDNVADLLRKIEALGPVTYSTDGTMTSEDKIKLDSLGVRYGTTEYWNSQQDYVPSEGEIVVYSDYATREVDGVTVNVPGIKIGNGTNSIQDIVFANSSSGDVEVELLKGDGDQVLGEGTTFTAAPSAVSFSGGTTDKCLGSNATFTTAVTLEQAYMIAEASGAAVGANGTDTFVKSYPEVTSKLATTTVPNVTSAGAASTWSFSVGTGENAETLIISGGNGTAPTLGSAVTVATGSLSANGGGDPVMTGLGTPTTASALTGVKVTAQPTVQLGLGPLQVPGSAPVAIGVLSSTTVTNSKDEVTAVTNVGTGTAEAQTISVGTNDKVKVALFDDLSISNS